MEKRLERLLEEYKLNSSQLADILGVQRSGISHILAGRNKPSFDFLVRIIQNFPEINANWLITGKGRMFIEEGEDELKPTAKPAMPSLFDSLESRDPKTQVSSKPLLTKESEKKEKTMRTGQEPEIETVYKSKHADSTDEVVEMVMILYRSGKFRRYIPD